MSSIHVPGYTPGSNQTTNPEVDHNDSPQQEYMSQYSAGRFSKWVALVAFSLVAWLAAVGSVERHMMDRPEKWTLTATTFSLVFSSMAVVCYIFARGVFMGQLPEVAVTATIVIFWAGALPVIMNPGNNIAVSFNDYLNANLYFGSWLSFFCVLAIAGDLAKEIYGLDVVGAVSPVARGRHGKWYALIATSLIAMSASVRVFRAYECKISLNMAKAPVCRQTKFAIGAGAVGTVFAAVATVFLAKGIFSRRAEWCSSAIMAIIWTFGLGYITFGAGPGQNIGNLYFSTWGSFILSVLLAAESFRDRMGQQEQRRLEQQQQQASTAADDDLALTDIEASSIPGTTPGSYPLRSTSLGNFEDAEL